MQSGFKLDSALSRGLLDLFIKVGLIAALVVFSFQVFQPFLELMLWSLILAVTLYPLQRRLKASLAIKDGWIATLIVVSALLVLLVPIYLLVVSIGDSLDDLVAVLKSGAWRLPAPPAAVADWPLIGPRLHEVWLAASGDLTTAMHRLLPHLKGTGRVLLGAAASAGAAFLLFIAAVIIAGIIMAFGEKGQRSAERIASRVSGPERGPRIVELCTATIRAVAQGVIGIAFIQMLLIGVGFVVEGVPGAGILAIAVLLLGIVQLPATLITVPVIAYVFSTDGFVLPTIVFAVYTFVAGLADNVLKPLLLGRGVDVPMPVVLIGALGGMVVKGVIGLFIGPVILAVAYNLFWQWIDEQAPAPDPDAGKSD
ncbi:AI-2E family transporter [Pseudomonas panipatensis]|uniref:Predicted PurR-regulated permease PerM n=1 Tax=Pseudomonas panipatensis TaxID=428992 RepID=A0A1G8E550_9PSED|nr:AI-2E family transporter [Pseudomonas panipatensis]SDH65043.1 Predicted PurR-regulated permease PerM [Pseudomonas panipatensis]SMP38478.1 Predicted PurR-regulated permease PerM [Pseudomonas panipatensis]